MVIGLYFNLVPVVGRDRLVVRTLRCGRNNPGSNPGHGTFFFLSYSLFYFSHNYFFIIICLLWFLLQFESKTFPSIKAQKLLCPRVLFISTYWKIWTNKPNIQC